VRGDWSKYGILLALMKFDFISWLFRGGKHAAGIGKDKVGGIGRERRILYPIASVCEQALSDFRDIGVLARAYADERGRDSGALPSDPIRRESFALIAAAKRVGRFVDASSVPGTRYTIRTGESEVRLVQKERQYYKIKNPFAKAHLKKHPVEYMLFEHFVHNILFPDCRLEFLGVAEDFLEARLVYRQAAVCSDARPDDRQIAENLRLRGLTSEGRYEFGNEYVLVTDVGQDGDNVLLDDEGMLRFIDPIIGFKSPLMRDLDGLDDFGVEQLAHRLYDPALTR